VTIHPDALRYVALSAQAKPIADDLYRALWSCIICIVVTVGVSLFTEPKPIAELKNLVMGHLSATDEEVVPLYKRPIFWAVGVAVLFATLQIVFW